MNIRNTILAATATTAAIIAPASAETLFGLTTNNSITVFDSATPGITSGGGAISGLQANDSLLALDFRPATRQVYAIGSLSNVYTINQSDFSASLVGSLSQAVPGTSFGFDFNPAFMSGQFARIISDSDDNRVVSGDTGQYLDPIEKTDVFYAAGDANESADPNIAGIAYTNSIGIPTSTRQFGIDATLGSLVTVANNAGELQTVGSLGITGAITNELGFDISGASGLAFASIQTGSNSSLYTVDLTTGAATLNGSIGSGDLIRDITAVPEPSSALLVALGGLAAFRRRR